MECLNLALSRNGKGTNIEPVDVVVGNRKNVAFFIPMVTEDYSNATMTVQGEVDRSICYKNFILFTQGMSLLVWRCRPFRKGERVWGHCNMLACNRNAMGWGHACWYASAYIVRVGDHGSSMSRLWPWN